MPSLITTSLFDTFHCKIRPDIVTSKSAVVLQVHLALLNSMHHTVLSTLDESVPQDKLTVKSPIAEVNGVDGGECGERQ